MACSLNKDLIEKTIDFHGHNCPGLTIGLRVAELAMEKLDICNAKEPVCVTETDMCAVDAVQFLTGCSFGKGNLIHRDFGKSAFTFFDRKTQKGFRAVFRDDFNTSDKDPDNLRDLMKKAGQGIATKADTELLTEKRALRIQQLLDASLSDLFVVEEIDTPPVRPARILKSLSCDACGEMTMESRIRLFDGQRFCIPCFETVEQKI